MKEKSYGPEQEIFKKDDVSDKLYYVNTGTVETFIELPN